jgi:hypothetical protein
MFEPNHLPSDFHGKLPAHNIEIVQHFILECHLDPNIFDISTCKNLECLMLLINSGYEISGETIRRALFDTCANWDLESKKSFITYAMNSQITENMSTLNIFDHVSRMCNNDDDANQIFAFIVANYSHHIIVDARALIKFSDQSDILEPVFSFSSKELVDGCLELGRIDLIDKIIKYCDPEDYLTPKFFKATFNRGKISSLKALIEQGYVPCKDDYPKHIQLLCLFSLDYLKSVNLWDGKTFDWDQHTFPWLWQKDCENHYRKWIIANGCPITLFKSNANFK